MCWTKRYIEIGGILSKEKKELSCCCRLAGERNKKKSYADPRLLLLLINGKNNNNSGSIQEWWPIESTAKVACNFRLLLRNERERERETLPWIANVLQHFNSNRIVCDKQNRPFDLTLRRFWSRFSPCLLVSFCYRAAACCCWVGGKRLANVGHAQWTISQLMRLRYVRPFSDLFSASVKQYDNGVL